MRRLLLLCVLGCAGCASQQYYYQPTEQATATLEGRPAARYGIPPESPRGDVLVTTFGVASLDLGGDEPLPVLHVRLVVANNGGEAPWTVDTREIRAELRGLQPVGPAFISASVRDLPTVQIPSGEKRTLDLYFPLPDPLRSDRQVPQFDVLWRVATDTRDVAERTPFERIRVEPAWESHVGYGVGIGVVSPWWWYDPLYSYPHPRPVIIQRVRPPHVHYYRR